jgi:hypothetical protein
MGIWDPRDGLQEIRPSAFDVNEEILARALPGPRASTASVG